MELHYDNTIFEALDIRIVQLKKDQVQLTMPVGPRTVQPMGLLHGGASVVLAESAASLGAHLNIDPQTQVAVGLEINANHVRSKRDGWITSIATPYHVGKTTMIWEIRIVDEAEKLICISRCTIAIKDIS